MPTTDTPSQVEGEVREEYFESHATGIELEAEDSPRPEEPEPWDPEKISDPHEALFATSSSGHDC